MIPLFRLSRPQRERLFADSGGQCQRAGCQASITFETMHVAHLRARANGGTLADDNVSAWCAPCNWKNGATDVEDTRVQPREWQIEALQVIVNKILMEGAATPLGGARSRQDDLCRPGRSDDRFCPSANPGRSMGHLAR
jgi:hypothetical protein